MSWRLFVNESGDGTTRLDGPGWALIDRLVQWCRDDGIRVILDIHSAPGGQTGHTYDDGTGYQLFSYTDGCSGSNFWGAPTVADGWLYDGNLDGTFYAFHS